MPERELPVPQAGLDTGCNVDLPAPVGETNGLVDPDDTWTARITGLGGEVPATVFEATLCLPASLPSFPVRVYAIDDPHWWIGLPLLRRFHLLLAADELGDSWLVLP